MFTANILHSNYKICFLTKSQLACISLIESLSHIIPEITSVLCKCCLHEIFPNVAGMAYMVDNA